MDRKLLKQPFRMENPPNWKCPTCDVGLLRIVDKTFSKTETAASLSAKDHEAWDPDWTEYRFSTLLKCTNDKCGDHVSLCGRGGVDYDVEWDTRGQPDQVLADFFKPTYFEPPLKLLPIPNGCPRSVSDPLMESFRLAFCSPPSSANFVRSALECLLTELHIARFTRSKGKFTPINLHRRIELLPSKLDELKAMLFAIKWLGNAGSHSLDEVSFDDVMDAYELISHVLDELYLSRKKKLSALAKKVNKRKGPKK